MGTHLWVFYALGAAILWGLKCALTEKILKAGIHPSFLLLSVTALTLPIFLGVGLYFEQLKSSMEILSSNNWILILILICALIIASGSFLIFASISEKNATAASMIEIAYPLFTALFTYILFKDSQLNWETAFAALLICSGIGIMYLKG